MWTYNLAGFGITVDDQRDCKVIVSCNKSMAISDVAQAVKSYRRELLLVLRS